MRVIPGNKVPVTTLGYETPRVEVAQILGYHLAQLRTMFQRPSTRGGYGGHGSDNGLYFYGSSPSPQFFTGAEAARLAMARQAERRDYRTEVDAVAFRPFGSYGY